ncbi:NYN domain-containing protein [Candidatus Saccharibacteria bacterium]|nr:NYN domain-containing protein [Candidatus Saccharibacteria bacterium]
MNKPIIYIDGQNFLYAVSESLKDSGLISDKQEIDSLDFLYLFEEVMGLKKYSAKYYGVKTINKTEKFGKTIYKKQIKFADNLRKMKNCIRKNGIEYIASGSLKVRDRDECKKCGARDFKMQEKGVDVGLAVDIVIDIYGKRTKHIILISSDTDLLPAIRIAMEKGIEITYVAIKNRITRAIAGYAANTVAIDSEQVAEMFARGKK